MAIVKPDYIREKFWNGLGILAEGHGRIGERLLDAYRSQISLAWPAEDLSEQATKRIDRLRERMTTAVDTGGGSIQATVAAMSEDDAAKVAQEIVSLTYLIERETASK